MVDNSLPAITLVAPLEGDEITGDICCLTLPYMTSIPALLLSNLVMLLQAAGLRGLTVLKTQTTTGLSRLDTMDFAEGTYDVSVRATDFSGNGVELADPVEVIIDNSAPELSLIVPVAGNYSGELQLEASATDGGTGVDFVQFGYASPGEEITWHSGSRVSLPDRWYYTLQTATLNDGLYA